MNNLFSRNRLQSLVGVSCCPEGVDSKCKITNRYPIYSRLSNLMTSVVIAWEISIKRNEKCSSINKNVLIGIKLANKQVIDNLTLKNYIICLIIMKTLSIVQFSMKTKIWRYWYSCGSLDSAMTQWIII